jgi:hypothetical protein
MLSPELKLGSARGTGFDKGCKVGLHLLLTHKWRLDPQISPLGRRKSISPRPSKFSAPVASSTTREFVFVNLPKFFEGSCVASVRRRVSETHAPFAW